MRSSSSRVCELANKNSIDCNWLFAIYNNNKLWGYAKWPFDNPIRWVQHKRQTVNDRDVTARIRIADIATL